MGIKKIITQISIIIAALVLTSQVNGQKVNVVQEIDGQPFFLHTVESGHTLYAIAKLYQAEVDDIIRFNPGAENGLQVGEVLKVPASGSKPEENFTNPVRIEGTLLIHRVLKGETLFAISRIYNVDVNTILEMNPEANSGLQKGQELKIPVNKVETDDMSDIQPAQEDSLIRHRVIQGETLYAIAKRYDVNIDEIKKANDGLLEGLVAESIIRIPKVDAEIKLQTKEVVFEVETVDPAPIKEQYSIGLLLPFYLNSHDSIRNQAREKRLFDISLAMYRGALIGLDSLQKNGLVAEVFVDDVHDVASLKKSDFYTSSKSRHLVIGPLQRSVLNMAAEKANSTGAHLVCPVPQSNKVLLGHPNLSKVNSSDPFEVAALAEHLAAHHQGANIILFNTGFTDDIRMLDQFRTKFNSYLKEQAVQPFKVSEFSAVGKTAGKINGAISSTMPNIIVALTENEVIIADMMRELGAKKESSITIYGTEEWMRLKFIDAEYRERYNLHVPKSQFYDFESSETLSFRKAFYDRFGTHPDDYALVGYDVMRYYGQGLIQFGTAFPAHFSEIKYKPISLGFDFHKTGLESGFENGHVFILEQINYQMQVADDELN